MKKSQIKVLWSLHEKLSKLCSEVEDTNFDRELSSGYGLESEQIGCAISAIECILQDYD